MAEDRPTTASESQNCQRSEPLSAKGRHRRAEGLMHRQDRVLHSRNGGRRTDYGFRDNRKSLMIRATND